MTPPRFDRVELLLVDSDLGARDAMRSVLLNHGFRKLRLGENLTELANQVGNKMPDLLIAGADLGGDALANFIGALRRHEVGSNPFLPVIALSGRPTTEQVRGAIDSGVDHFVAKPFTAGLIYDRLDRLVRARKPFVVTSYYIGPDRRSADDRPSKVPLIDVPNSLNAKALSNLTDIELQRRIDTMAAEINVQRLERHAFQIGWLIERLAPALELKETQELPDTVFLLEQLLFIAEDTSRRLGGTKYDHVSDLCRSLLKVAGALNAGMPRPNPRDIQLLIPLGQSIQAGFAVGTADAARRISDAVGR